MSVKSLNTTPKTKDIRFIEAGVNKTRASAEIVFVDIAVFDVLLLYSFLAGMSSLTSTEISRIKRQLTIDEGSESKIYLDSLGYKTFGIGHLIKDSDPESKQPIGTKVSSTRIDSAFTDDFNASVSTMQSIYPKNSTWPSEVREIMVNMTFNLGGKLHQFKKLSSALEKREWNKAADEMVDSKWHGQVKTRAERLVKRMRAVKDK